MKKVISVIAAAAMMCAAVSPVFAANRESNTPDVFINGAEILFNDQAAVIVDGRTLVPARGVFEAMGATVSWDEEKQQVQVESADNNTWVRLIIDDADMKVYDMSGFMATLMSGQDFVAPETVIALDAAPQIINDRTMVPLRAISEAIEADVKWDEDSYSVQITSDDAAKNEKADGKPAYTLSAGAETVNEGDTVDIYINAENIPEGKFVLGVAATLQYNKENFEFVETKLMNGDKVVENALGADNTDWEGNYMKASYITIDVENAAKTAGAVMKLTFKSLNGKEGSFALSDSYLTGYGCTTRFLTGDIEANAPSGTYDGSELYIDTTPVTVNAGK